MRPAAAALGLAFLMIVVAFAVPARPAQGADAGMYGGNLRMAILAAPSWNPLSTNPSEAAVHNLVWDTLARPDPATGEPKPWAAQSWSYDSATETVTVTPRAGLTWSSGTAITAGDLATTFRQYGFTVSTSGSNIVFDFSAGGAGRFYSEALYGWIAWNSAQARMYSGLFYPSATNTSVLLAHPTYWAGRAYLNSVSLVATTLDNAACRLLKSHTTGFPYGVDFIGFPLLPNDLSDERSCSQYGGFRDSLNNPVNKSLVNPNGSRSEPFVSAVHHPGPRYMYYWMNLSPTGALADVNLRRALYLFVNKQLAGQIEPSSTPTHSLINRQEAFWYFTGTCPGGESCEVVRDAGFTTIRDPGGTPRQDTNPYPAVQALDMAGYLDRNADGWRETPTGAPLTLNVGVVGFNVDPRKTTIVGAYVDVIGRQGVRANLLTYASWADLRTAEATRAVDIALDSADAATSNPRYMETFAPLLAAGGLSDPDARNVTTHLNLGKNATTLAERVLHYNHVTFYNSKCACVLPVLHYETLEAYDRDAFVGWVDGFGGVNSAWSFAALMLPQLGPLTVALSALTHTVSSGGQTQVQVTVTDMNDAPVLNATVAFTATAGSFSPSGGLTDANGRFRSDWTAPAAGGNLDATVTATVTKTQYSGATASTAIAVHPVYRPLDVAVSVGGASIEAPNSTTVEVLVTSGGLPVADANVSLSLSLPGGVLGAYSGTTAAGVGTFSTTFTASPSIRSIYRIDVTVQKTGYAPGSDTISVLVSPKKNVATDFQSVNVVQNVPGFEALVFIGALGAAVAIVRWRQRREG